MALTIDRGFNVLDLPQIFLVRGWIRPSTISTQYFRLPCTINRDQQLCRLRIMFILGGGGSEEFHIIFFSFHFSIVLQKRTRFNN